MTSDEAIMDRGSIRGDKPDRVPRAPIERGIALASGALLAMDVQP